MNLYRVWIHPFQQIPFSATHNHFETAISFACKSIRGHNDSFEIFVNLNQDIVARTSWIHQGERQFEVYRQLKSNENVDEYWNETVLRYLNDPSKNDRQLLAFMVYLLLSTQKGKLRK